SVSARCASRPRRSSPRHGCSLRRLQTSNIPDGRLTTSSRPAALNVALTTRTQWIVGCSLLICAVMLPLTGLLGGASDDIFITYRYASNLAEGAGFVFNPGERLV